MTTTPASASPKRQTPARQARDALVATLCVNGLDSYDAAQLADRLTVAQRYALQDALGQAYARGITCERNAPWNRR